MFLRRPGSRLQPCLLLLSLVLTAQAQAQPIPAFMAPSAVAPLPETAMGQAIDTFNANFVARTRHAVEVSLRSAINPEGGLPTSGPMIGRGGTWRLDLSASAPLRLSDPAPNAIAFRSVVRLNVDYTVTQAPPNALRASRQAEVQVRTKTRHGLGLATDRLNVYCLKAQMRDFHEHAHYGHQLWFDGLGFRSLNGPIRDTGAPGMGQRWYEVTCRFGYDYYALTCGLSGVHADCLYTPGREEIEVTATSRCVAAAGDPHPWDCQLDSLDMRHPLSTDAGMHAAIDSAFHQWIPENYTVDPEGSPFAYRKLGWALRQAEQAQLVVAVVAGDLLQCNRNLPAYRQHCQMGTTSWQVHTPLARYDTDPQGDVVDLWPVLKRILADPAEAETEAKRKAEAEAPTEQTAQVRLTPMLKFALDWSDAPACWRDGLHNAHMGLRVKGARLGNVPVGQSEHRLSLRSPGGPALWSVQVEDTSLVLGTSVDLDDASGQALDPRLRFPNACHLRLTELAIVFDDAEVRRELVHLREAVLLKMAHLSTIIATAALLDAHTQLEAVQRPGSIGSTRPLEAGVVRAGRCLAEPDNTIQFDAAFMSTAETEATHLSRVGSRWESLRLANEAQADLVQQAITADLATARVLVRLSHDLKSACATDPELCPDAWGTTEAADP